MLISTVFPLALSLLEQIIQITKTMRCRLVVRLKDNVKEALSTGFSAGTWVSRRTGSPEEGRDIASYKIESRTFITRSFSYRC